MDFHLLPRTLNINLQLPALLMWNLLLQTRWVVDTISHSITVYPMPIADFSTSSVCLKDTTFFAVKDGDSVGYLWNFGNSTSSTDEPICDLCNCGDQYSYFNCYNSRWLWHNSKKHHSKPTSYYRFRERYHHLSEHIFTIECRRRHQLHLAWAHSYPILLFQIRFLHRITPLAMLY